MSLNEYPNTDHNSWITIEDADTYFEGRLYSDEWENSDQKEKALLHAFRELNTLHLEIDLDTNEAALLQLQAAQCEQALHRLQNDPTAPGIASVSIAGWTSIKMGNDSDQKEPFSPQAMALLHEFMRVPVIHRTR